ncbi:MAG: zf-HC2 domain-containing protein [Deltaproteobacteria bacterium]|nr:zf-HC2 domain-containing protein [Deltaproteobacteria bacterium]
MKHLEIETLSAHLDGDLDAASGAEAEAHLGACAECAERFRELGTLKALALAEEPQAPEPDLWPAIARAVARPAPLSGLTAWLRSPAAGWAAAAAMAGLAILALARPAPEVVIRSAPAPVFASDGELEAARISYLRAIERLEPVAAASGQRLPAPTRAKLLASLELVDREIAECERLLSEAPEDPLGQEALLALYDEKVRVLRASIDAEDLGGGR